jgi:hypothetical protein
MRSPSVSPRAADRAGGVVIEIGGNDGGAVVVVAGIQNQAHRVPDPFRRFDCAQFVEHQHFGVEHGPQNVEFGGIHRGVIGVLDFLKQFPIIVEQTRNTPGQDQVLDDPSRQVGLAHADLADDEQACTIVRVVVFHKLRGGDTRQGQRGMGSGEVGGEA